MNKGRKERIIYFKDALKTFLIYGYVASDMAKDHSAREETDYH